MRFAIIIVVILVLSGCGSSSKKEYGPLEPVVNKLDVKRLWSKNVGQKSFLESKQFGISLDNTHVYVADAKGNISVLKQENGEIVWQKSLGELVLSGPTVDGDLMYVGGNNADLYALSTKTGDLVWETKLSSEVLAAPAISEKFLYVQTIDGKLHALDKNTGNKIWVDKHEVPALTLRGSSSPIVLGSKVIAGFANGKLTAFDAETGSRLWETSISIASGRTDLQRMIDIDGPIQADKDQVYAVTYQGRVAAVSHDNGRTTWSREMSAYNGVKLDGQEIYLSDASDHVWAIDRKTGATIWRQDKLEGRDLTGVTVLPDSIVVADGAGFVHWLSREDGSFLYRENLLETHNWAFHDFGGENRKENDYGVSNEIKVANNKLYVRSNMGNLSVFLLPGSKNN